ncbi:MAG: hypothetical protein Q4D19_05775 [Lautropia sp.]|nr:hypothetical protein [Lautropia sp.]
MGTISRTILKTLLVAPPMFIASADPLVGSACQMLPVAAGVVLCANRAIRGAWRDGWLAEI